MVAESSSPAWGDRLKRNLPWPERYAVRLFLSDVIVIATTLAGHLVVLGSFHALNGTKTETWTYPVGLMLLVFGLLWLVALDAFETRDWHVVGHGISEYRQTVNASLAASAITIAVAFFFQADIPRSLFLIAVPIGTLALCIERWSWRQWLRRRQLVGQFTYRVVVIGERTKATHIVEQIVRTHGTGYQIVGVVTVGGTAGRIYGAPIVGNFHSAIESIERAKADTVILASADDVDPQQMRRWGWALADRDINLIVAPALTDVAGPRIHATPVAGLPLVHVDFPTLEGWRRFGKRAFDIVGTSLLVIAFSPVFLATMIAIKVDSKGPLFYTQERIGRRGQPFQMIKFRSMVANADDQLASLLDVQGTSDQPLFKVTNDPRITKVGRFIRKHSIDELPQLFNVLFGTMSLVGPRPQRDAEVALYDDDAHRRLLVKPGMSGLWQVSGRSALSWEDALRLDLYYVENWSFTQDLQILFRTVKAVVAPGNGAH